VQCGGSTEHAGGRRTSYWSAIRDVVIHSLDANIGHVHALFIFLSGANVSTLDSNEHYFRSRKLWIAARLTLLAEINSWSVDCNYYSFLYSVHKMKEMGNWLSLSVRASTFQLQNRWMDCNEIWYEGYVNRGHTKIVPVNHAQSLITTRRIHEFYETGGQLHYLISCLHVLYGKIISKSKDILLGTSIFVWNVKQVAFKDWTQEHTFLSPCYKF
jgi:hypothetical protein